jgi:hypothetical protein
MFSSSPPFVLESMYTGYTQKNGAVSKVNKKSISQLTRAQHTGSAAATAQVCVIRLRVNTRSVNAKI